VNSRMKPLALAAAVLMFSGCAQMLGQLRADLNDDQGSYRPTVGGAYPEGGYLDDDRYGAAPGHYDRSPAAMRSSRNEDAWSDERDDGDGSRSAEMEPNSPEDEERPRPREARRATRNDFIDQAQDSGSLWASNSESNFFFSKNRARSPGDIVTITIEEEMLRDIQAEVKRTLTGAERRRELDLLESKYAQGSGAGTAGGNQDQIKTSAAAPVSPDLSFGAVDVSSVVGVKAGDSFLAEIIERYPNGNYKIRGSKRVPYRNTTKLMSLVGIVRGNDLGDEKVPSGKIYEYRLQTAR
jgi:flagellar basal body L-ring protein FlgH